MFSNNKNIQVRTATLRFCKLMMLMQVILFSVSNSAAAQDYVWAFTAGKPHHTQPVAIRKDNSNGNLYLAAYTDSLTVPVYTSLEKRTAAQQLIWQMQIDGDAVITDMELNAADHPVVTGYFKGSISVDGNLLTGLPTEYSGFIMETDESGSLQWIHALNPLNTRFRPVDLFIAADGQMYMTAETSGTGGYCSFHRLDPSGNILKNEFTTNIDNQRFSHIIADSAGNVYLSGTCGNLAVFDTIAANPAFSYQNFLIKYDSSFKALWFIAKDYITFDHNNKLCTDGKNLYWAFDDFVGGLDTVKIVKTNYNGQLLSSVNAPVENAFFPSIDYSVDHAGNSTVLLQAFVHMYLYRYDTLFNITWQDTLATSTSGTPLHNSLVCYDSSFYMQGSYIAPSLTLNAFTITNANTGISYPSDMFVFKWGYFNVLPLTALDLYAVLNEQNVMLRWTTLDEVNAVKFIIEKSEDGISFKATGFVDAKNNNYNAYEFPDNVAGIESEIIYYRLRQIDKDGHSRLSKVVTVKLNPFSNLQLFPGPVKTILHVQLQSMNEETVVIRIHDMAGKLIMQMPCSLNKGKNVINIDSRQFVPGNYVISIVGKNIKEHRYFIKQ